MYMLLPVELYNMYKIFGEKTPTKVRLNNVFDVHTHTKINNIYFTRALTTDTERGTFLTIRHSSSILSYTIVTHQIPLSLFPAQSVTCPELQPARSWRQTSAML